MYRDNRNIQEFAETAVENTRIPGEYLSGNTPIGSLVPVIRKTTGYDVSSMSFEKTARKIYSLKVFKSITLDDVFFILSSIIQVTVILLINVHNKVNMSTEERNRIKTSVSWLKISLGIVSLLYGLYHLIFALRGRKYELGNRYTKSIVLFITATVMIYVSSLDLKEPSADTSKL